MAEDEVVPLAERDQVSRIEFAGRVLVKGLDVVHLVGPQPGTLAAAGRALGMLGQVVLFHRSPAAAAAYALGARSDQAADGPDQAAEVAAKKHGRDQGPGARN